MPRPAKSTKIGTAVAPPPKKAAAGKKNKLYTMPEKIVEGTVLQDLSKTQWRIGPSIGTGGFGEIYSACRVGEKNYDYVVKCEPHGNGPLFVEMHFYMRNAKLEDIQRFQRDRGLKALGMPYMLGNGSADINGQKHRFIVMPRYGSDVARHFTANGRRLPEGTAYRLALQMIDVYEFVHTCGYVHADLKAANILLGLGRSGAAQAYLVDYGLASHFTTKDFKPDPKKMHNGTIEYTSRDAHQGVATMRADLEILGYNLIEWLGAQLPWVKAALLAAPVKVQQAKEEFMKDVSGSLKAVFAKTTVPAPLLEFMKYVAKMQYNETPDYDKCRKIFAGALKTLKIPNSGDLEFKIKSSTSLNNNASPPAAAKKLKAVSVRTAKNKQDVDVFSASDDDEADDRIISSKRITAKTPPAAVRKPKAGSARAAKNKLEVDEISASDDDDLIIASKRTNAKVTVPKSLKATAKLAKYSPKDVPAAASTSPRKRAAAPSTPRHSPPKKSKTTVASNGSGSSEQSPKNGATTSSPSRSSSAVRVTRSTPISAKTNINFSPAISVSRTASARPGKTIINDSLTPNPRAGKTYEFNFELDVSMDANVVVNVKRKKKTPAASSLTSKARETPRSSGRSATDAAAENGRDESPVTRVKVRKLAGGHDDAASGSPRTPAVTVKKSKLIVTPR